MAIIIIIKFEKIENDFLKGHDNYLDLMSFTGITFCVTVARDVRFIAASFLQDR